MCLEYVSNPTRSIEQPEHLLIIVTPAAMPVSLSPGILDPVFGADDGCTGIGVDVHVHRITKSVHIVVKHSLPNSFCSCLIVVLVGISQRQQNQSRPGM